MHITMETEPSLVSKQLLETLLFSIRMCSRFTTNVI